MFPERGSDEYGAIRSPLSDVMTFSSVLAGVTDEGGGSEPSLDVPYYLFSGESLHAGWRAGANRLVIVFTDENPQSYRASHGLGSTIFPEDICMVMRRDGSDRLVFFSAEAYAMSFMATCNEVCTLSIDPTVMTQNLNLIIDNQ